MIGKLNHVGVAPPSIEASWKLYRDVLGVSDITQKRALPEQGVWVSFVNLPNVQIELIEPYGADSPIHGFLAKNPKGGQDVGDLEAEVVLAALGVLRQEAVDRRVGAIGLDQLDLGVGQVDEAEGDALFGQGAGLGEGRGAQESAVNLDRGRDRRRGVSDVVQPSDHAPA